MQFNLVRHVVRSIGHHHEFTKILFSNYKYKQRTNITLLYTELVT